MIKEHYRHLVMAGLPDVTARQMANYYSPWPARRLMAFKLAFVVACISAVFVIGVRWSEAETYQTLVNQAYRIEFLERVVSACQSKQGGLHVGNVWHRCILREAK